MTKDMRNSVMKELNTCHNKMGIKNVINETNIYKLCKSSTIETGIKYGLSLVTGVLKVLVIKWELLRF